MGRSLKTIILNFIVSCQRIKTTTGKYCFYKPSAKIRGGHLKYSIFRCTTMKFFHNHNLSSDLLCQSIRKFLIDTFGKKKV